MQRTTFFWLEKYWSRYLSRPGVFGFFTLLIVLIFQLSPPAMCNGGIGIKPIFPRGEEPKSYFEYHLKPGEKVAGKFQVRNRGDQEIRINIIVRDAVSTPSGALSESEDPVQKGIGAWVKLPVGEYTLKGLETKTFDFELEIPPNAPPGDAMGFIFVSVPPKEDEPSGTGTTNNSSIRIKVSTRVGLTLWNRTPGNEDKVFKLEYGDILKKISGGQLFLEIPVHNKGNVYVRPNIGWTVKNPKGNIITEEKGPGGYILPGNTRVISIPMHFDRPLARGEYSVEVYLEADDRVISSNEYKIKLP